MKILFKNANILFADGTSLKNAFLTVDGKKIDKISKEMPEGSFDRTIDCTGKMLCPGLYNCHAHSPMSIFRGYGENLPLDRWLSEKIWPAEDKLCDADVYLGSMLSIAEMLKNGIVSFSDMYFFSETTVKTVIESGIKANIGRCITAFDPAITAESDSRFAEGVALHKAYHGAADGRVRIDMSIHAEYTTVESTCRYVSDYAYENGVGMQIHLSETAKEHEEGKARRGGKTPAEFFLETGVFRANTTAAHCVHVSDSDIKILAENGVTVAHNPASNLKLGSGIMPLTKLYDAGVNITLGTDGSASNNTLDILKEAYLAALLQKGTTGDTAKFSSAPFVSMATVNGAKAQGRAGAGVIAEGAPADLILINLDDLNTMPYFDLADAFLFSAGARNVYMTMVDGNILYENGVLLSIDEEKLKYDFSKMIEEFYKR
jgi:5-methylthioadenosine/S-adenosylhomocysteine deaminase